MPIRLFPFIKVKLPGILILMLFMALPLAARIPVRPDNSGGIGAQQEYPLIIAAEHGDIEKVRELIKAGADVNRGTDDDVTALMYAASNGFTGIVRLLVENGADLDAIPWNGITALSGAAINNNYDIVLYLLQQGADPEIADMQGITPLLYAAAYDFFEITELLLMFGSDPMHADLEGGTPLHAASLYASPDIAWLLLDYGAEINSIDHFGFTPLMMAVQPGRNEMVDYLLLNNANIHLRTRDNLSALAIAVANNHPAIAETLIRLGADPKEKISFADNLMNLARWQGNEDLIAILERHGVRANILPDFRTLRLSWGALFNTGDFFSGPVISLEDTKYNLLLSAGWQTRPVRRAVLVEYSDDWYDQLWEQRHLFFGSLHRIFPLKYPLGLNEDGFYAGFKILRSQGRYWGTYRNPGQRWHFVPSAGYYKAGSWWFYNAGYEYLQLRIVNKSPHRISFGAGIRLNIIKDPLIYRTTYW
jgi:ankyrin repeat protein